MRQTPADAPSTVDGPEGDEIILVVISRAIDPTELCRDRFRWREVMTCSVTSFGSGSKPGSLLSSKLE